MRALANLSDIVIPILVFFIVGYGFVSKVKVYESFLKGAKDGLKIVVDIMPTLIGLLVAVGMLRASGFFDMLGNLMAPVTEAVGLPAQLVPLMVVKLFSASAATGLVLDIFRTSGPDSNAGLLTSILMSCTDNGVILRRNKSENSHVVLNDDEQSATVAAACQPSEYDCILERQRALDQTKKHLFSA